jgi:integrase
VYEGIESLPKGNKVFSAPLNSKLKDYLLSIKKDSKYIVNSKGNRINHSSVIQTFLKELQISLGFDKVLTTHSMRHTFVSLMVQSNESKTLIKQFTSHKDFSMIDKIYTHHISSTSDLKCFNSLLD